MITTQPTLFLEIENLIKNLKPESISDDRKEILKRSFYNLDYIQCDAIRWEQLLRL